jgi:predicted transport protein
MDFSEIDDPSKLCRDVTGLGRWGNVEVVMEKLDDLPYIMGLARQSLEKQLGDENDES